MPRYADEDEFKKHERDQEEILWLQDFAFDMKKVPFPTILLVGKRFSGKSYTSVSIAAKFDVPRWAAWCGTKDTEDFWAERFESNATVKGPDEHGRTYLNHVIKYQQRKGRLYKKILKQPFPRKFTMGLIFDDVTAKRQFRKGEILEDLFSNGRHYHLVIIISAQYLKQLPPAVRLNTDYMFITHNTKRTLKIMYEEYVEAPDEFGMFLDLVRSVTGQRDDQGKDLYNALVYDNVIKSQKLEDVFRIYRNEGEKYLDNVKIGDEAWREYNKAHFKDEDYEIQVREYRKQQRILRLEQHRQRQMERRANPLGYSSAFGQADLDFYDDTDSEDETDSKHDTVTLTHRSGPALKVNFHKHSQISQIQPQSESAVSTKWALPTESAQTPVYGSGSTPYGTQPSANPYGTHPYGTHPYGAMPNVQHPYASQQQQYGQRPAYASNPYGATPSGAGPYNPSQPSRPYGAMPYGSTPYGTPTQYGASGAYSSGASPYGSFSSGSTPYGYTPQYGSTPYNPYTTYGSFPSGSVPQGSTLYQKPQTWAAQQDFIRAQSQYVPSTSMGATNYAGRLFL